MTISALYEGHVFHRRIRPREHFFRYGLGLCYLDLEELPELFRGRWLWSARRPSLVWFRRADYLGSATQPLREAVLDRVESELGRRPEGAVRLLTQLRTLGYLFNPVSFYLCHDREGGLEALVAEITNTPWGERHAYVLDARRAERSDGGVGSGALELRWRFPKAFHVSPFHDMRQIYDWCLRIRPESLEIRMANLEEGRALFQAGLACRRREISPRSLAQALLRHPFQTLRLHAAIYWQAARLWAKRTPFFPHPRKRSGAGGALLPR